MLHASVRNTIKFDYNISKKKKLCFRTVCPEILNYEFFIIIFENS